MYEADHVVRILQAGRLLQREIAKTYNPDRDTITALCQDIQNSTNALYKWARGIEEETHG